MILFEDSYLGQLRRLVGNRRLITPAVRAIIQNEQGHILFVQRSDNRHWVMPAGSLELNESVWDALKREVVEETGLQVIAAQLMAIYSEPRFHFTNAYGGEHQMLALVFVVTEWEGELQTKTDETTDARFFAPDHLPEIPVLYQETLEDLHRFDGQIILK